MSYKGISNEFLEFASISIGDSIKIFKNDIIYEGMVLDKETSPEGGHMVLKLKNGHNIGSSINETKIKLVERGLKTNLNHEDNLTSINVNNSIKKDVSIISTGGTVASVVDDETGAVHPAFTAEDIIRTNPELMDQANIKGKTVLKILSENIRPKHWIKSARAVRDEIDEGAYGVVVAHGTDTMHYTASALSFILDTPVPVVLTGAQLSLDKPSSDAFMNLVNSVTAAESDLAEVMVCMHATENDSYCFLHRGTRVRKMHSTRKDAFKSINVSPMAKVQNGNVTLTDRKMHCKKRHDGEVEIKDSLEEKVAFIKSHPGISGELIDYHIDKDYKGIIIEGTGLGHCPVDITPSLQRARDSNIPVVMTSQCLYGEIDMGVYSSGRKLTAAGVIPARDMLPETALVKLMWTLGQTDDLKEVQRIMHTNIAGEIENKPS
ncbi:Glu-tRNA(Gln) amidotransferase subunit GatD [Methanobacterium sp. BAmetb5]|uniref:Glu-tRNA(Gln) amidotransferase subunit GatD n=1 Tax=Methanobacterium sp. BAmetb5 TaxID=2025351 RepID=UPI000E8AB73A|nr:Glu-tRNA(Gln) amidotransferase subunit GatD [Methanobacterium sp. BAmetb5]AXV40983.1 MAG: Glu-tRNA(Gln) amidotransferase GatDE subunit D [Methanobacterium sp. BAmetb5]